MKWIEVDPAFDGERSWVNPDHIERVDVNTNPEPPWALLTLRSGAQCTISIEQSMHLLSKAMMVEIPRTAE